MKLENICDREHSKCHIACVWALGSIRASLLNILCDGANGNVRADQHKDEDTVKDCTCHWQEGEATLCV